MALRSAEASVGTGLAAGALASMIYFQSLPPLTDVRSAEPGNQDVDGAERAATWLSAGIVAGVALITQDATVFIIGGATVVAMAWLFRHANQVQPLSGLASGETVPGAWSPQKPEDYGYMDIGPMAEAS